MFEYIFKNYKNLPLEIDDPSGVKIPNPEILQNNDVYQYFKEELHLTFLDPTINDVRNEYLQEYFTISVMKINRDLTDFQLSTEEKFNELSINDKLHLRNAICLLIKHIFDKGNDSFQTNKSYSISPVSVSDSNQFLKFEYSEAVISELEQVSVFFLAKVAKKRENQLGYDDKFFQAVRDTFYDLFIDNYPSTANVLVSKLLESKDFEDFIKQHAKGEKGDKGDPGSGGGGAEKTNDLLTFDPTAEGGINQYLINKDNKDNRSAVQNRLISNENKILSNENKINENDVNIRNNRSNVTNARNDIANNRAMIISNVRQTSTNTALANQNKTRLDNLSNIGSINDFIKFNDTNIEFWNQGKKIAEWFHASTDVGVHLIKFFENLSMSNNKITDLASPVFDNDAVNKKYVDDAISVIEREGIDVLTDKSKFGKRLTQNSKIQEKQKLRVFPSDLGIVRNYRTLSGAEMDESSFRDSSMDFYSPGIERITYGNRKVNPAAFVMTDLNNLDLLNNQILIIKDGTFEPEIQRNYPSIISNFKPIRDRDIIRKQDLDEAISKIPSGSGGASTFKDRTTLTTDVDIEKVVNTEGQTIGVNMKNVKSIDGLENTTPWIHKTRPINGRTFTLYGSFGKNIPYTKTGLSAQLPCYFNIIKLYRTIDGGTLTEGNITDSTMEFFAPSENKLNEIDATGRTGWINPAMWIQLDKNNPDEFNNNIAIIKDGTFEPETPRNRPSIIFPIGSTATLNNTRNRDLLRKDEIKKLITDSSGVIKKFTVIIKNNRQPYIIDNTTGENITLTTIPSGLKTQIELNFPFNTIINNSRWKVLCEFVPTVEDIQTVGDATGDFITVAGLIVPNDPSPIDNMIYVDVWDTDFKDPGTTFNTTQYHISQQVPENNIDRWDYTEYQAMGNLFMLIHYQKYNTAHWDQPHIKRKFKFDFESQFIDNKRNNYIAIESQMKNQGKLYLVGGATKLSPVVGQQKIDIMTKINVEHANNRSDIQNLKIYFQKMTGSRTALNSRNFTFIEPGNGTKLTFILQEKYDEPTTTTTTSSNGYDEDSPA